MSHTCRVCHRATHPLDASTVPGVCEDCVIYAATAPTKEPQMGPAKTTTPPPTAPLDVNIIGRYEAEVRAQARQNRERVARDNLLRRKTSDKSHELLA